MIKTLNATEVSRDETNSGISLHEVDLCRVGKIGVSTSVLHLYYVMLCEWDEEKNLANQEKHDGLDFETASLVFEDSEYVLVKDRVDASGEQRYHAIGQVGFGEGRVALLVVVHVYRKEKKNGKEIIRIISAREADKRERKIYRQKGT